jgi:hypothetical protein
MKTIDLETLQAVTGGAGLGYDIGYGAGYAVTSAIAPFNQKLAFTQVGGPWLRSIGFPNAANGAEQGVRDVAAKYGATVRE